MVQPAVQKESVPLDRRLERFVQRYFDSPLKVEVIRTLAHRPNRFYTLEELATFTEANSADLERALFSLRQLGLVATKERQRGILIGLASFPVVRDMAIKLLRYTSNAGGRTRISKLVRTKRQ